MADNKKKRKSLVDSVTYAYIRKVKKWMFCPNCHEGKMTIDKKSTVGIVGISFRQTNLKTTMFFGSVITAMSI